MNDNNELDPSHPFAGDPTNPFAKLHPADGFRAELVELGDDLSVHVKIISDGCTFVFPEGAHIAATVELAEWRKASPADRGAADRLCAVADAICRYFTTGGNWDELTLAIRRMGSSPMPGGLIFPGYHLLESTQNSDFDFEHIFVKDDDSGQAVLWVEDRFIEPKTLSQIRVEREDAGWAVPAADQEPVQHLRSLEAPRPIG